MGDKLTDTAALSLLALLRTDAPTDTKVASLTLAKSSIKQHNLPDAAAPPLFESTRLALLSTHTALVNAGFTTLNHLLTRMTRQEPRAIARETKATLPLVVERLGDQKEKYRTLAGSCLTAFWRVAGGEVERGVREGALVGKSARAKEAGMGWIVQVGFTLFFFWSFPLGWDLTFGFWILVGGIYGCFCSWCGLQLTA